MLVGAGSKVGAVTPDEGGEEAFDGYIGSVEPARGVGDASGTEARVADVSLGVLSSCWAVGAIGTGISFLMKCGSGG